MWWRANTCSVMSYGQPFYFCSCVVCCAYDTDHVSAINHYYNTFVCGPCFKSRRYYRFLHTTFHDLRSASRTIVFGELYLQQLVTRSGACTFLKDPRLDQQTNWRQLINEAELGKDLFASTRCWRNIRRAISSLHQKIRTNKITTVVWVWMLWF